MSRVLIGLRFPVLMTLLVALIGLTPQAHADSPVSCSASALINAINTANASADDDTLSLAADCAYTFTSADNATDGGNGLPVILDAATAGTLTINGNGATIARSQAVDTPSFRLFYVNSGGNLTLNNLVILNGLASGSGGAIANFGSLTLNNSALTLNSANAGGAIYNDSGTLTLNGTTLNSNSVSTNGGGLLNDVGSTATLIDSTIAENAATSGAGGGIYNLGTLLVNDSSILVNLTSQGGLQNFSGTVTLNNSLVGDTGYGMDCINNGGTVTVNYSLIQDGSCGISGGTSGNLIGDPLIGTPAGPPRIVFGLQLSSPAINSGNNALIPSGVTTDEVGGPRIYGGVVDMGAYEVQQAACPHFPATIASGDTAALNFAIDCANTNGTGTNDIINLTPGTYVLTVGLPTILNAATSGTLTFNGNGATIERSSTSGAIKFSLIIVDGTLTVNNLILSGGQSNEGGAIANETGTLIVNNSTLSGNSAYGGGGIYNNGTLTINNSTFSGNSTDAAGPGGGILNFGTLTVNNSTFSGNTAGEGGAIYNNSGTLTITNSTLSGNSSSNFTDGGAIDNRGGTLTLDQSVVSGNSAGDSGGGLFNESGVVTISSSTFSANSAIYGGGMFSVSGTVTVTDSTFTGNSAGSAGAVLNHMNNTLTLRNSTLSNNTARDFGGGLLNGGNLVDGGVGGPVTISNSTLSGNSATAGGGIWNAGPMVLSNSTISGNSAHSGDYVSAGGGILSVSGYVVNLGSSIVAGNTAPAAPAISGSVTSLGFNVIDNTSGATFVPVTGDLLNEMASPLNLGALANNGGSTQTMALGAGSVAIGHGNCTTLSGVAPITTDQTGASRKSPCDVGAYETHAPSITTHPQTQTIYSGQTAALSVVATGTAPLSYQWYLGTAPSTTAPVGINSASFTTPVLTTTSSYWVRVSNSFGHADSATAVVTIIPPTNLVSNGDFSAGTTGWTFNSLSQSVKSGVLNFAPLNGSGGLFQRVSFNTLPNQSYDLTFSLGNLSATAKTVNAIVHNATYSQNYNCVFNVTWLPSASMQTYTLRFPAAAAFLPIVQFQASGDASLALTLDNINLHAATTSVGSTQCRIEPPVGVNLVQGGDFTTLSSWAAFSAHMQTTSISGNSMMQIARDDGSPSGGFYQYMPFSAGADDALEFTFQLANDDSSSRVINMVVRDGDWIDTHSCFLNLPGNSPLTTYTMRVRTAMQWQNIVLQGWIYTASYPSDPVYPFRFDNLTLTSLNSSTVTTTDCPVVSAGLTRNEAIIPATAEVTVEPTLAVTLEVTDAPTAAPTVEELPTGVPFPTLVPPTDLPTVAVTEEPTLEATSEVTDTPTSVAVLPTGLPFPTLAPPTDLPTALPFPTLPPVVPPTDLPTVQPTEVSPLPLPAIASMDDGAPDWLALSGWALTPQAAYGGQGLGWQVTAANPIDLLRWTRSLDLRDLAAGQAVQVSFQSWLTSQQSSATVQVSVDGTNWLTVGTVTPSDGWTEQTFDLSAYAGQTVQLQFLWQGAIPQDGQAADTWLVDQVAVTAGTVSSVPPTSTPTVVMSVTPTDMPTDVPIETATDVLIAIPTDTDVPTDVPTHQPTDTAATAEAS